MEELIELMKPESGKEVNLEISSIQDEN